LPRQFDSVARRAKRDVRIKSRACFSGASQSGSILSVVFTISSPLIFCTDNFSLSLPSHGTEIVKQIYQAVLSVCSTVVMNIILSEFISHSMMFNHLTPFSMSKFSYLKHILSALLFFEFSQFSFSMRSLSSLPARNWDDHFVNRSVRIAPFTAFADFDFEHAEIPQFHVTALDKFVSQAVERHLKWVLVLLPLGGVVYL